jgi:hypothetical protein
MKAEKWMILGALAGLAAVAINKQLRLSRNRMAEQQPPADDRSSIDDVPEAVPTVQAAASESNAFDERIAPSAPL